ncbi:MAG TPA: SGNH/GDSL hydrolase family protein [Acidimicrobiia bacterium]|nr:SGNH/GDSL hydrolase family protein [Acidimicrobiia bacterium]
MTTGLVRFRRALAFLLVIAVPACFGNSDPPVRVLFVGNSYTHVNDLPGMVGSLAASADIRVEVGMMAPGGWWWRDHAASEETTDAIAGGDWDYVVMQEQSMAPADRDLARRASYPAAELLSRTVVGNGGQVVLFLTWGHRNGSPELGHSTYSAMQVDLADSYLAFADSLLAEVAPVGMAWWMSLAERREIDLYQADGSHPSLAGSYLAAAVIAAVVLDVDPASFDAPLGLDESDAAALRGFAARAVSGEVPWEG